MMRFLMTIFLIGFVILVILLEMRNLENGIDQQDYFDIPNPDHQLDPNEDQDPHEKFADNSHHQTLTSFHNHGPSGKKRMPGRPPSPYGPRVYRTLRQNKI